MRPIKAHPLSLFVQFQRFYLLVDFSLLDGATCSSSAFLMKQELPVATYFLFLCCTFVVNCCTLQSGKSERRYLSSRDRCNLLPQVEADRAADRRGQTKQSRVQIEWGSSSSLQELKEALEQEATFLSTQEGVVLKMDSSDGCSQDCDVVLQDFLQVRLLQICQKLFGKYMTLEFTIKICVKL